MNGGRRCLKAIARSNSAPALEHILKATQRHSSVLACRGITCQIVLELKYYDGMTVRELAAVYDVPRATMADRVARARTRLAKIVARLGDSPELVESTISGLDDHMQAVRRHLAKHLEKT